MVEEARDDLGGWSTVAIPDFLGALAARRSSPSGGAGAAITLATAAALVAMSARFADTRRTDSVALATEVDGLRERALALMDADAAAFAPVLKARRWGDVGALEAALEEACEVPMGILEMSVRLAELGADLVVTGNPRLAGDAQAGVRLASGAGLAAAALVWENLGADAGDGLAERAHALETRLTAVVNG